VEDGGKIIVRICRAKAAAQGDHLRPGIELLAAVVTLKRLVTKICFGHRAIASRTAWVHRPCNTTCSISRSSKLSEVAPQHDAKARQMVVFLPPTAGAALLFLSRLLRQQSSEHHMLAPVGCTGRGFALL